MQSLSLSFCHSSLCLPTLAPLSCLSAQCHFPLVTTQPPVSGAYRKPREAVCDSEKGDRPRWGGGGGGRGGGCRAEPLLLLTSSSYLDLITTFKITALKTRNTKHTTSGFNHNIKWVVWREARKLSYEVVYVNETQLKIKIQRIKEAKATRFRAMGLFMMQTHTKSCIVSKPLLLQPQPL